MRTEQYGMKEYYRFFKELYPKIDISRKKFNEIVSDFNKEVANDLIDELDIRLPYRLGNLEIRKEKRGAYIDKQGNLKNNVPINWKETNELWEKDPISRKNKILIRHNLSSTNGYVFRFLYNKQHAIYRNKVIYFFRPVRSLARSIKKRIDDYSKPRFDSYIRKPYRNV